VARALALAVQIADALAAAHAASIVHRDLKPSNLIISPGDRVKICDFGLARDEAATTLTPEGSPLGTPVYMAPSNGVASWSPRVQTCTPLALPRKP
jgi:serine/threonine protein kinase